MYNCKNFETHQDRVAACICSKGLQAREMSRICVGEKGDKCDICPAEAEFRGSKS